ncbi:MAG TPA: hypothetical protein VJN22_00290 [Candidatus Eremiobacteraceae bacterium]|nr:hypothetical protein [Candidatus Eremiobacteraceae bacterium]
MRPVACLVAGTIASIVLGAGIQQAAATPSPTTLPAVPVASTSISLFEMPSQASNARGAVALRVFGFERIAAAGFDVPAQAQFGTDFAAPGLALARVLDLPPSAPDFGAGSLVTDAVFGVEATSSPGREFAAAPIAFAAITSSTAPGIPATQPAAMTVAAVGLKFKLLGGDHVVAFDSISSQIVAGAADLSSSPFFFGAPASAPATAVIGLDRNFQRLALGAPDSGSLLAIGSGEAVTTPAFAPAQAFGAGGQGLAGTDAAAAQGTSVQLNFPLTLGNVDARLSLSGRELHDMRPTLVASAAPGVTAPSVVSGRYQEFRGGVTIGVPVFKRKAEVSLNGVIDRLVNVDKSQTTFATQPPLGLNPFLPPAASLLTQSNPTLTLDPNYVNLRRYVGAYAVAVPINTALTANMQYVDQRYGGDAVNALAPDLSVGTREATFGVLYKIPNTNASINLNFNQYKFLDDLTPANNFVKNRQNLYFTVKF